jgi:phenylacetic acid degradation operon negative regulatory protein
LPAELLPGGWAGVKAAELFHERHDAWDATGRQHWSALLDSAP